MCGFTGYLSDFIEAESNLSQDSYFGLLPDQGALEFEINGDINQDNIINVQDIIIMVNLILGNMEVNDTYLSYGDVNQDSLININDIIEIIFIIYNQI